MNELPYFPGLEGVVAGETAISSIEDGLRYRGYEATQLAARTTFEETAYLLLHGELPNCEQLASFRQRLSAAEVPPRILDIVHSLPESSNGMDVLRSATSLLAHWDPDAQSNEPAANLRKAERLVAQLPVILANWHRRTQGLGPTTPKRDGSLAEKLLEMLHNRPASEAEVKALDVTLVLYAEHEFNASTFTARVVSSTLSDLHSAITAAIGALKGPLHGGANERVMEVLEQVGSPDRAEAWINTALANKQRVMGFGHRVYKQGDPRAEYLKPFCQKLAADRGQSQYEEIAEVIERAIERAKGLRPNLDWPSARLYHYLGLPVPLYTPLFVISRVTGWCAHVIEQLGNNRLIRPRAKYIGTAARELPS